MHFTHFENTLRNLMRENASQDERFRKYSTTTMRKCGSLAMTMGVNPIPLESGGMTPMGFPMPPIPSTPGTVPPWGFMNTPITAWGNAL